MGCKIFHSMLILLLMWGGIDDLVISTANADPSDDVATSENDDYIPATSVEKQHRRFSSRTQLLEVFALSIVRNHAVAVALKWPPNPSHDPLNGFDSLYAFMSLQC